MPSARPELHLRCAPQRRCVTIAPSGSLGVKPKLVQTILRRSRRSTTMDLYVHAYVEDLRDAVNTLDRALDG